MPNHSLAMRRSARGLMQILFMFLAFALSAGLAHASGGGDDHDPVMETLWQAVNLALILGVIIYFARGPIGEYFATRRNGIQTELSDADELLRQAERRNAELQRRLLDLSSETENIREGAGRRAEEEAERILADARAAAERIRRDAKASVDQELRRAQSQLRDEAADLALEIAARRLTESVGEGDRERLMDEFITRIEPSSGSGDTTSGEGANR
ncbi:MAG: F0F1 ATP synthase subunit B [bacterium]|nr:F0F1 ATP synthase subunit B [bacterium]